MSEPAGLLLEELPSFIEIVKEAEIVGIDGLTALEAFLFDNEPCPDGRPSAFRDALLQLINEQRMIAYKMRTDGR